jgi:hypothetical protein
VNNVFLSEAAAEGVLPNLGEISGNMYGIFASFLIYMI